LNFRSAAAHQQQLARERDRLGLLLDVTNALVTSLDFQALFANTTHCLRRVIPHEYTSIALRNGEALRVEAVDYPGSPELVRAHVQLGAGSGPAEMSFQSRKAIIFDEAELRSFPSSFTELFITAGMRTLCCLPLIRTNSVLGVLMLGSSRTEVFRPEDTDLLCQVANQIAIALDNALAYQQIAELKDRLNKEKLYLEDEIRSEHDFGEIVGVSHSLKRILQLVQTVAPTDSTVLIRGETGTGKELIARAIHNFSGRKERTFVKLNCAAIPTGLLESELFGHERGAFTGAIAQRIGRFELAHQGTLFLDEVGDIPLELQPKLLRVLQEMEFERLGSTRTLKVNVRLVAATNRDLPAMVSEGRFRSDLYYRLNIFPVHMPPLRERADDIPKLVQFFAQKHGVKLKKKITTIVARDLEALRQYSWPGNIRELENFVERAVILSRGVELALPMGELRGVKENVAPKGALVERRRSDRKVFADRDVSSLTLKDAERQHILTALRAAQWKIGGPTGAAARLGMKRTTLNSRMKRLGISRLHE
jgi:formate hydrogenlyase transcriptional activator